MGATTRGTGDAVVVPADHGGSSLACIRSLGRRGVPVLGVASGEGAPALRSKYCDERHVVPSPDEDVEGYRSALLDLAGRGDVRTVVPMYEPDIYVLAESREAFAGRVATPWSGFERVRRAQDRRRLVDLADLASVPTPDTALLGDWDRWDERSVIKSRYGVLIQDGAATYPGVRVCEPGDPPDVEAVIEEMGHEPIVQEYVPGDAEHGFFALYDEGTPVATFQHRRVRSYTYAGGASVYRESFDDPRLDARGTTVLDALDWHGPAMVEFKRDARDGRFKLIEVNPRFWGSLPLALHAGVDFPGLYYDLTWDAVDRPVHDYDTGVGCHALRGEASYLHSVLRYDYDHVERPSPAGSLRDVVTSVLRERNFDYLSVDDPAPFVRDALKQAVG
jgi:predicted ATP-grasp superfamily ATP-dependent carboligase